MFVSYKYMGSPEDKIDSIKKWKYEIKDTEFTIIDEINIEVPAGKKSYEIAMPEIEIAVINTYLKRNLPISKNLFLAMQWHVKNYPSVSWKSLFSRCQKLENFDVYSKDFEKYFALI